MTFESLFVNFSEGLLFGCCLFIMVGSVYISYKSGFVQLRLFSAIKQMVANAKKEQTTKSQYTISPQRALLTAMSTTIGLGVIVAPVIAIYWGGPGALLGFLVTSFFGSAATYTEVGLSIKFRKKLASGQILGGPMQYMKEILSPAAAAWYAFFGALLMGIWSAAQANQLAAILDSSFLGDYRIPTPISGAVLSVLVLFILYGGIQRVGALSAKLVPAMFVIYISSLLWIIGVNIDKLGGVLSDIFVSAFSPYALASGGAVGGLVSAMRWGVFKGTQCTEAGVGTQTIPHSMAETKDPEAQALLSMVSTYTAGMISFLSGVVALITGTWQDPSLSLGIGMVAASFELYFSHFGVVLIALNTLLFAFGTILGNSFNGSQCFGYLTQNKKIQAYYLATAIIIFFGTVMDTKQVWSYIDIGLAFLVLPHMFALMLYTYKQSRAKASLTQAA